MDAEGEDAEFDIYGGLDEFASNERNSELENALKTLEQKYDASVKEVECLKDENQKLKAEIKTMNKNFKCLLLTAKAELSRKQAKIDELTQKRDDICFRRKTTRNETTEPAPVNSLVMSEPSAPVVNEGKPANDDRLSQSPHSNSNKHDQPRYQKHERIDSTHDAEVQSCDNRVIKVNRRDEQNSHNRYPRHDYNRDRDNRKHTGSNPFRSRDRDDTTYKPHRERDLDIRHTKRKHEDRHDERDERRKIERHDVKRRSQDEFEYTERNTKRYRDERGYCQSKENPFEELVYKMSRKHSIEVEKELTAQCHHDSLKPSSIKHEDIPENVLKPVLDMENVDSISSDDENFSSVEDKTPCMSPVEMEGNENDDDDHEESQKTEKQNCHGSPEEANLPDAIKQNDSEFQNHVSSPCDSTSAVPVKAQGQSTDASEAKSEEKFQCSETDCKPLLELRKTPTDQLTNNENSATNIEGNKEEVVTSEITVTNNNSNKDVKNELLSQENPTQNETQYMNFASGLNDPSIERSKLSQRGDSPASKKSTSSSISVDTSFQVHEPSNLDEISHILSAQNERPEDVKCQARISSNQKQIAPSEQLPKDEPLENSTGETAESVNKMKHLSVKKISELCDTQETSEADLRNVFLTKKHKASIQGKETCKNSVPHSNENTLVVKEILKTKSWEPMKPRKYATPTKKEKILSMGNPNYSISEKVAIPEIEEVSVAITKDIPTGQDVAEVNIVNSQKGDCANEKDMTATSDRKNVIESPLKAENYHETITAVGNLLRYFAQDASPKDGTASTKPSLVTDSPGSTKPKNESREVSHLRTEGDRKNLLNTFPELRVSLEKLDEAVLKKIKKTQVCISSLPEKRSKESTTKSRKKNSVAELTTEEMVPANNRIDPTFANRATKVLDTHLPEKRVSRKAKKSTVSDTEHKLDSVPTNSKRARGRPRKILATEVLLPDQIDINSTKDLRASTRIKKKVDYDDYVVNENNSKKISRTKSPKKISSRRKSCCELKVGLLVKEDSPTISSGKKVAKTENENTPKEHSENISHVLNLEEHAVFNVFPSNTSKVACDKDSSKEMNVSDTNRRECKNVSIKFEELFGKSPVQDHKEESLISQNPKIEKDEVNDLLTVLSPDIISEHNKIQEKPSAHEKISISTSVTDYMIESVTPNIVNVFVTRKKIKKKKNLL